VTHRAYAAPFRPDRGGVAFPGRRGRTLRLMIGMETEAGSVPAVVLSVEDTRTPPSTSSALAVRPTVGGLVRFAGRLAGLVRRPLAAPLAIATAPLGRADPLPDRPVLALRHDGVDVDVDELVDAYGVWAGDRLLVMVPPPGRQEDVWERGRDRTGATYAERLRDLLGWTPVHLRVDEPAEGGFAEASVALSALLQRLVDRWPVPPRRIILLGLGGGGIVARSAAGIATTGTNPWVRLVSDVIALDTPAYAVASGPGRGPVSQGGRRLEEHLAGIAVVEQQMIAQPPADGVDYVLVTDALASRPNVVGRVLGDLLWWRHRPGGRARQAYDIFPTAERFEISGRDGPLGNHPKLHDALLHWLT